MLIAAAIEAFLAHRRLERGASPATLAAYRSDLTRYAGFVGGGELDAITAEQAAGYVRYLRGEGGGPGLAASSTARAISAVRALHRFALAEGLVAHNITDNLAVPKLPDRLPKALTVGQVEALLAAVSGEQPVNLRNRAMLELLYGSGLRIGELVALDVDDVGSHPGLMTVRGKGGKWRHVPVSGPARSTLTAYLVRGRPALMGKGMGGAGLFLGARGGRLGRQVAWAVVRQAAQVAGLADQVGPHTLRHCFATHLLQGGADIRVVQELLGHSSVTTTQIYTKVSPDMLREVYTAAHPRALVGRRPS